MDDEQVVEVALGERTYHVRVSSASAGRFGFFARESLARTWAGKTCRRGLIVTDENVAEFVALQVEYFHIQDYGGRPPGKQETPSNAG